MGGRVHPAGWSGVCRGAVGNRRRAPLVIAFAVVVAGPPVEAANWSIEPGVRVSETWTDNFALSAEDPEDEWITEIAPTVRVSGEGRRVRLDLAYRLQHLLHVNEAERDGTNHRLNAAGDIELVRERLFFDADATRSLSTTGTAFTQPTSSVIASDQRRTVTTWSAGPRLQYPVGRLARLEAALRRSHVDFGSDAEGDSDSDRATVGLASGPLFTTWGWALDYERREESRDRRDEVPEDTTFEQVRGELNLRAGAATQLFVAGGTEDNEFETAEAGDATDGDFWEAGFRWNPRRTVSLEMAAGERFFGETARASLNIRGSSLTVDLDYSESLVTAPQLEFERVNALLRDADGNLVIGPGGDPVTVAIDVPTVRDDVSLQQRAGARVRWSQSHTSISFALLATEREFQRDGTREETRQADLDLRWTRLTRTTLSAGIGLREQEFFETGREDEFASARLGATRQLRGDTELQLEYEYSTRDSTDGGRDYDNNRVTLALEVGF